MKNVFWDWNVHEDELYFISYFEEEDEQTKKYEVYAIFPFPVSSQLTDQASIQGSTFFNEIEALSNNLDNKIGPKGTWSVWELNDVRENQNDIIFYFLFGDCALVFKMSLQIINGKVTWMKKFEI